MDVMQVVMQLGPPYERRVYIQLLKTRQLCRNDAILQACDISKCSGEFPVVVAPSVDEAKSRMQEAMSRTAEACFSGRSTDADLHYDALLVVSLV